MVTVKKQVLRQQNLNKDLLFRKIIRKLYQKKLFITNLIIINSKNNTGKGFEIFAIIFYNALIIIFFNRLQRKKG